MTTRNGRALKFKKVKNKQWLVDGLSGFKKRLCHQYLRQIYNFQIRLCYSLFKSWFKVKMFRFQELFNSISLGFSYPDAKLRS